MNLLFKLAPHAAILIGNMYYVFWGIDRVNKAMDFIDNGCTKFLLALLCAFSGLTAFRFIRFTLRQMRRRRDPRPLYARMGLLGANVLMAGIVALLLLCDLFLPDAMIFLNEFVKVLALILCILSLLNGLQLIILDREIVRAMLRRAAQPRRPAAPVRQAAPVRRTAPRPSARIPENRAGTRRPAVQSRRPY